MTASNGNGHFCLISRCFRLKDGCVKLCICKEWRIILFSIEINTLWDRIFRNVLDRTIYSDHRHQLHGCIHIFWNIICGMQQGCNLCYYHWCVGTSQAGNTGSKIQDNTSSVLWTHVCLSVCLSICVCAPCGSQDLSNRPIHFWPDGVKCPLNQVLVLCWYS